MFEIQHYTFCDGWVNTSTDENGNPVTFDTAAAALAELNELLTSHIEPDCIPYDPDEYRVIGKAICPVCVEVNYYTVETGETGFITCGNCKIAFQVGPIQPGIEKPDILVTNEKHDYPMLGLIIEVEPQVIQEIRDNWKEIYGWATGTARNLQHPTFNILADMHDLRSFLVYLRSNTEPDLDHSFIGSINVSWQDGSIYAQS